MDESKLEMVLTKREREREIEEILDAITELIIKIYPYKKEIEAIFSKINKYNEKSQGD